VYLRLRAFLSLFLLGGAAFVVPFIAVRWFQSEPPAVLEGMAWIPGGEFTMSTDSDLGWPDEKTAHRLHVDAFWMAETEVTNAPFRAFVEATGYLTTAEILQCRP
jgi:sulfatase modifying factor 1